MESQLSEKTCITALTEASEQSCGLVNACRGLRYKKVLCITAFGGWTAELAGKDLDNRAKGLLIPVSTIEEIKDYL